MAAQFGAEKETDLQAPEALDQKKPSGLTVSPINARVPGLDVPKAACQAAAIACGARNKTNDALEFVTPVHSPLTLHSIARNFIFICYRSRKTRLSWLVTGLKKNK